MLGALCLQAALPSEEAREQSERSPPHVREPFLSNDPSLPRSPPLGEAHPSHLRALSIDERHWDTISASVLSSGSPLVEPLTVQTGRIGQVGQRLGLPETRTIGPLEPDSVLREEEDVARLQDLTGDVRRSPLHADGLETLPPDLPLNASNSSAQPLPPGVLTDYAGRRLSSASEVMGRRCDRAVKEMLRREAENAPPPLYSDPLLGVVVSPLKSNEQVRIVYVLGLGPRHFAHMLISRLLYALYSPSNLFLIHADVKAPAESLTECMRIQEKYPNVHILRTRRLVQWGMFTMVAITLDAIRSVVDSKLPFDYVINLSDVDLSLRTDAEMQRFFARMRGRSLINVHEGGGEQLIEANKFINAHTIIECGGYGFVVVNKTHTDFPLTAGCCIGRSGPAAFGTIPLETHSLLKRFQPHTGSQWLALHRDFCHYLLDPTGGSKWLQAFERRLVPDESFFQTVVMHSPFRRSLLNHNLRWIDWPHQYGDANEYWQRLGGRKYVGGPKVINSSELSKVLASPYMFARKVDVDVDPSVLPLWDAWMKRKLTGARVQQAPIGFSPGDTDLERRFRAPGVSRDATSRTYWRRRRIVRVDFTDGSRCGCGVGCGVGVGGCCSRSLCADQVVEPQTTPPPCPRVEQTLNRDGGEPARIRWFNRARHPVTLFAVNYAGVEVKMHILKRLDDSITFNSNSAIVWRARALNGALMLEHTPRAGGESTVDVHECAFETQYTLWAHRSS